MTKVERAGDLPAAYAAAAQFETLVFAEPWLTGSEYTVAILQGAALPSIRIETPKTFYDYEAKYFRDDTRYFCPSGLSAPVEAHLASLALAAFEACGAGGWGRADFMMDAAGQAAAARDQHHPGHDRPQPGAHGGARGGHRFPELCWRVLETSFTRSSLAPAKGRG